MGLSKQYIPSRTLSKEKGYNIYLNKLHDAWEKEIPTNEPISISIILVDMDNKSASANTLMSLKNNAPDAKVIVFENDNIQEINDLAAQGENDWFIYLRAGDEIFPWTMTYLQQAIASHQESKAILFDHDTKQNEIHSEAHLKPYFNKRYLLEYDLIKNGICFHSSHLLKIADSKFTEVNDAIYAWLLTKELKDFYHLQLPLLSHSFRYEANYKKAILDHYPQNSLDIKEIKNRREINFNPDNNPTVSIIIPFRDKVTLLKNCLASILELTVYPNYEVILADNNSEKQETLDYLEELKSQHKIIKHLRIDCEFNFSYINNQAVKVCEGDYLLFLNNDTEILHTGWLQNMVGELEQEGVGAVGAQLLYEDRTIQHAGVVPGIGHVAGHIFRGFAKDHELSMHNIQTAQEVGAVTGACLLTTKDLFAKIGGFDDENLKIAYNDVDLCFKILNLGLKIIYTPHSQLVHYESKSRNFDLSAGEKKRYDNEVGFMKERHFEIMNSTQFYHPALTKYYEDYRINVTLLDS